MKLIRKHALLLSLLSILAAAVAAPYMIPENPDSMVFRSGVLGLLLLCAAGYPLHTALRSADRRTLTAGLVWGFLFAGALSLGSELFVYNGLLRGFGPMVRRAVVPVLAAPLFGGFASFLMLPRENTAKKAARPIPPFAFFAVIFLCWVPLLLAYFPGMLNYDFLGQYSQHIEQNYSSIHPLLHSALANTIITIGEMIHSRTFGVLLMSLVQMALFAASLAYACIFAQRRGASRLPLLLMTTLFALHPIFSVMALSMTKDTLFAACILVLSLLIFECLEDAQRFLEHKGRGALFVLVTIGAALLRNNGVFALALLFPAMILACRSVRKRVMLLCAASVGATLLTLLSLNLALTPEDMPSIQFYSVPAQQLVRAYNSEDMTAEDKAEIRDWYVDDLGLVIHPHLGDGAKGYIDRPRAQEEGEQFLAIWQKHMGQFAHEYIEAFLMLNVGSWYPDDLSHSTIYPDASWNDKGYLQTQEYDMTKQGIVCTSFLPKVKALYERICRRNDYQEYPILSVLFCPATPLWALVFACCHFAARRKSRMILPVLGALGLWASYLLGPCTLPRYALPLFCLAPVLLILSYCRTKKEPAHD